MFILDITMLIMGIIGFISQFINWGAPPCIFPWFSPLNEGFFSEIDRIFRCFSQPRVPKTSNSAVRLKRVSVEGVEGGGANGPRGPEMGEGEPKLMAGLLLLTNASLYCC